MLLSSDGRSGVWTSLDSDTNLLVKTPRLRDSGDIGPSDFEWVSLTKTHK